LMDFRLKLLDIGLHSLISITKLTLMLLFLRLFSTLVNTKPSSRNLLCTLNKQTTRLCKTSLITQRWSNRKTPCYNLSSEILRLILDTWLTLPNSNSCANMFRRRKWWKEVWLMLPLTKPNRSKLLINSNSNTLNFLLYVRESLLLPLLLEFKPYRTDLKKSWHYWTCGSNTLKLSTYQRAKLESSMLWVKQKLGLKT